MYVLSMRRLLQILKDNIGKLHELAKYLYEHETITGEEFMKILETPVRGSGSQPCKRIKTFEFTPKDSSGKFH